MMLGSIPKMSDLNVETVINAIKRWEIEAKSFRNDGWVQAGYKEKLKKVFSESGKSLTRIKNLK